MSEGKYGRTATEWDAMVRCVTDFLVERARLKRVTSYTEVNAASTNRGLRPFDFGSERDRAAMGAVLGEVSRVKQDEVGALLSAIVTYLNENDAGPGFFSLAADLGLLTRKPTPDQRLEFWSDQVKRVHAHYA